MTEDAIEGYTEQITPTEKGVDIKNTHEIETVEISGNKVWEDDNNRDRLRPESVTVTL